MHTNHVFLPKKKKTSRVTVVVWVNPPSAAQEREAKRLRTALRHSPNQGAAALWDLWLRVY